MPDKTARTGTDGTGNEGAGVECGREQEMQATGPAMSQLIYEFDWSSTALGRASEWPDSLKAVVRILLTSGFPMWMAWGPELTCLYNDAYARTTLGKKHPSALGQPASEVWPEIWKEIHPLIERVMKTGETCWEEVLRLILERNGYPEETFHTFSYSPLEGPDGSIAGMLCVVIEDTVRVIGERQLSALSALAGALAGTITGQDVYAAIERGVSNQNDLPWTLTYLFEEEGRRLRLVAKTGFEGNHAAAAETIEMDAPDKPWPIDELLEANGAVTMENLASCFSNLPSGSLDKPPMRARLVPIARQGQERPAGVFIAALNPYRELDAGYAGFLDLVAGQIAASITNAKAYEEERQRAEGLAELDRAKTAFFSNVSHELRTPLTLILGPIEDALANQEPPSQTSLEMLHRNALRLLKLVNGLLDFVRIEVGRLRASYEATDLSLLTAQLASVFRSAADRAGIQLVVECPPLPEPVYVDREMWEKIVLNLISNALKSTFEGEIRVTMSAADGEAQLRVIDTGTGIAETELPHLFQRFRRIDGARRRSHEGSGIGLALVRELVEMHGGSITVASTFGRGTTFAVAVPFGRAHLSHGRVVGERQNPITLQGSTAVYVQEAMGWLPERSVRRLDGTHGVEDSGTGGNAARSTEKKPEILVADDNADMREYLTELLGLRFAVTAVGNGKEALEQAGRRKPALVLTDVMMPELDGFGLLAGLRKDPGTRPIPVIMLSARAGEESRIEGMEAGADDYLTKPFTARELVARVEAQLKLARVRREAIEQEASLTHEIYKAKQFAWEVLEHIPEVFYIFDEELRFTYVNAMGRAIAERMERKFVGETLFSVVPDLRGTVVEENLTHAITERVAVEFEFYYEPLENWFQYRVYPLPDGGLAMYARDITEERKTEQALRKSEQLAAAGRLAASISHEINNPLEAVTNLLFLAKMDSSIVGNTKGLLELADKELQRLSHIAARSLKFYRQRTAATPTSLEELIESVLFFHETEMGARAIVLRRKYREAPKVLCFPGEIQQVVTNLVDNALDALERHGRMIVAVRPARDGGGHAGVAVTVADTGSGMERETLERLFSPFVTTKGESGNGLGLWVSKGIVDKHHGTLTVRSQPNHGSVFRLFLPLDAAAPEGSLMQAAGAVVR